MTEVLFECDACGVVFAVNTELLEHALETFAPVYCALCMAGAQ